MNKSGGEQRRKKRGMRGSCGDRSIDYKEMLQSTPYIVVQLQFFSHIDPL